MTSIALLQECQCYDEDLTVHLRQYCELAVKLFEDTLVGMCVARMVAEHKVHLENIPIPTFSKLYEATC